jgi:hypothetical protein
LYNRFHCATIGVMAPREEAPSAAELHFEGDSLEVLSCFPDEVKRALGFSLRQLQIGREPTSQTRSMSFHRLRRLRIEGGRRARVVPGDLPVEGGKYDLRVALF